MEILQFCTKPSKWCKHPEMPSCWNRSWFAELPLKDWITIMAMACGLLNSPPMCCGCGHVTIWRDRDLQWEHSMYWWWKGRSSTTMWEGVTQEQAWIYYVKFDGLDFSISKFFNYVKIYIYSSSLQADVRCDTSFIRPEIKVVNHLLCKG